MGYNYALKQGFDIVVLLHGDINDALATREVGISALFVSPNGHGYDGETISFWVTPNYFAAICATGVTVGAEAGLTTVMMVYPPQNAGEIVRVWASATDGTRGSIDVVLPKDVEEEDGG